ncbi:MAG TPA: hypothetical protein VHE30_28870 [Polyangiaceae bacterium]|nr:hypothetical protein [Polyangiaceae bacterium]
MTRLADDPARGSIAPASGSHGRIKGVAFAEFLSWYDLRRERGRVARAVREVAEIFPGEIDPAASNFGVLASRWYPAEVVHALVDRVVAGVPEPELVRMADDAAEYIMGRTLRGVYRTIFSMIASPSRYLKYVDRLWSVHYDTGHLVGTTISERCHQMDFVDWRSHHSFICRMNMAASRPIYVAMGLGGVTYQRLACVSDGHSHCRNVIRWEK